ncbi:10097_t:CDS:2 [Funneliformis caledonium]|uniref:10097_t:CDS:1 n=1 Tax=Funneliformis caledonium TaxID=1117310 RepID=A0A9N9C273_9GLOM|nr:10097_t:CDS:2 [Funneliformis caledonium]
MSDMEIDDNSEVEYMNIEENNNNTSFLPLPTQIDSVILETKPYHSLVSSYDFSKPLSATAGIKKKYLARKRDASILNPIKVSNSDINEAETSEPLVKNSDFNVVESSQPPVTSPDNIVVESSQPPVASFDLNVVEPPVASSDLNVVEPSQPPIASFDLNVVESSQPPVASSDLNVVESSQPLVTSNEVDTLRTFVSNSEDHNLKSSQSLVTNSDSNEVETSTFVSNSEDHNSRSQFIPEEELFENRINLVKKEHSKGNDFSLLESPHSIPPTNNQPSDQRKETNVSETAKADEKINHISNKKQFSETTNDISKPDAVSPPTNDAPTHSMGYIFSNPHIQPVLGRLRKKSKYDNVGFGWANQTSDIQKAVEPTPCYSNSKNELYDKQKAGDKIQNGVSQSSQNDYEGTGESPGQEVTVTSRLDINKGSDIDAKGTSASDVLQKDNQIKNVKECKCLNIIGGLLGMGFYSCHCDASKYENVDFDNILKEEIPDKTKPIPAKKSKRFLSTFLGLFGYETDDDDHDKTKLDHNPEHSSKWNNKSNPDVRSLDPLAPLESDRPYSHQHTSTNSSTNSNPHTYGNSPFYKSYASASQSSSSSQNSSWQDNNIRYGSSHMRSNCQQVTSFLPPKVMRLLILSISFDSNEHPNLDEGHSTYYHSIFRNFKSPRIDTDNALNFIYDCIINCWANSWKVALVVSINQKENPESLHNFFKKFRSRFESEILNIILIRPSCPTYIVQNFHDLGIAVAKGSYRDREGWKQEFSNMLRDVITKAYRPNKYGKDDILFYNKDEPYYEFTNFYRAKINIDRVEWPTTEHYFQAAKFESEYIRDKIRFAFTAREAFSIARSHNSHKREDWESPKPPDNDIFKETKMKDALFSKFTQHVKLKYKLLSTGKAKIYEHTENDRYWGDGGKYGGGLNRLGTMLVETRNILMENEKSILIKKHKPQPSERWIVSELKELRVYDDLIHFE